MSKFNSKQFVKDRHKAFSDVLYNDSLTEMRKYCRKYGMKMPTGGKAAWIMKAGALKAIQECTDFSIEDKMLAMRKAIEIGTNPFLKPYGYDEEEK